MSAMEPTFTYVAVDRAGRRERGRTNASSAETAARAIEARGLLVLEVRADERAERRTRGMARSRQALLELTRALAAMLASGTPLARALATAAAVVGGEAAAVATHVRARVVGGESLAATLAARPDFFPRVYVGIVRAGERAGDLASAFALLATQLERSDRLRSRLVGASLYPLVLAAAGSAALLVLLVFVLPRFAELLATAQTTLPPTTAALLGLGSFLGAWWPVLVGGLLFTIVAGAAFARTERGRRAWAALLVRIPMVGTLRRQTLAASFARLTSVMLSSGASLLPALEDTAESLADPLARDEARRLRSRVREGASLSQAMGEGSLFPAWFARLVALGEEAGHMTDHLDRAAALAEERTERALHRLVTLAEPAMILLFGGMVAFVALALLQAIYGVSAGTFR